MVECSLKSSFILSSPLHFVDLLPSCSDTSHTFLFHPVCIVIFFSKNDFVVNCRSFPQCKTIAHRLETGSAFYCPQFYLLSSVYAWINSKQDESDIKSTIIWFGKQIPATTNSSIVANQLFCVRVCVCVCVCDWLTFLKALIEVVWFHFQLFW